MKKKFGFLSGLILMVVAVVLMGQIGTKTWFSTFRVPSAGTEVKGIYSTTAAIDFASIPSDSLRQSAVPLSGVNTTGIALVAIQAGIVDVRNVTFDAYCGTDTIWVVAVNTKAGALNPGSLTFRVVGIDF